jgi:hypothetical protein
MKASALLSMNATLTRFSVDLSNLRLHAPEVGLHLEASKLERCQAYF